MAKSVLGKIFRVTEVPTPRTLLLTDTAEVCGRGLLYSLVLSHLRRNTTVLYLTTTVAPDSIYMHINDNDTPGKLVVIDGGRDPYGWNKEEEFTGILSDLQKLICDRHRSLTLRTGEDKNVVVVVLDKLEYLTCYREFGSVFRDLVALANGEKTEQLVVYSGRDCVDENLLSAVTHQATAIAHLSPTQPLSCSLCLKKASGKVIKTNEEFTLSPQLELREIRPVSTQQAMSATTLASTEANNTDTILASQTTFNLTLTDTQRNAKNSLLLPHTRIQAGGGGDGGGLIHYTPDDVDDWDDDDPDDDLDI